MLIRRDNRIRKAEMKVVVCITRRGEPVARLTAVDTPRRPIDVAELRALTDSMPMQTESAGDFVRRMRDGDRY